MSMISLRQLKSPKAISQAVYIYDPSGHMRINLGGKYYNFQFTDDLPANLVGECSDPNLPNKYIKIRKNLKEKLEIDTIAHEIIHRFNFNIDEEVVTETATAIAEVLWRVGYRKHPQSSSWKDKPRVKTKRKKKVYANRHKTKKSKSAIRR